jgi:hypothetical protein
LSCAQTLANLGGQRPAPIELCGLRSWIRFGVVFWGRRDVTVPIGAVAKVETDAVTLALSRDEVGDLDAVSVRRHGGAS